MNDRKANIDRMEKELSEIRLVLQGVMDRAVQLLAMKQREMESWKKLATLKRWDDDPDTYSEPCGEGICAVDDSSNPCSSGDADEKKSKSSSLRTCRGIDSGGSSTAGSPVRLMDESMLSATAAEKLARMRHQEARFRDLLQVMKGGENNTDISNRES